MATKQAWQVGQAVKLGGRELFVVGTLPPAAKGLACRYVLETLDKSKAYEWTPFRGLRLVRGELVRPERAARRKAQRAAARRATSRKGRRSPAPAAANRITKSTGLWSKLLAPFRRSVKRPAGGLNREQQEARSRPIEGQPGHQ